jgi:hypothetical protein
VPIADVGCVVEFESVGGSKMRIHWKTAAPPDWTVAEYLARCRAMIQICAAAQRCGEDVDSRRKFLKENALDVKIVDV